MTTPTPNERLEAARRALDMGFQPVAVPRGQKGPTRMGWQNRRYSIDSYAKHFSKPGNLGVLLGEPSGWLVDVDLDCPEAIRLAEQFLPETPVVTGRPMNPRSHRWYIAEGVRTVQFRDPVTKKMIIEVRSTGAQTLVGPSIHPDDGDRYDDLTGTPGRVEGDDLIDRVRAVVRAVLKERGHEARTKKSSASSETRSEPCTEADTLRRAGRYLAAIPSAISGLAGHSQTYAAATAMVHGFGLDPETAFRLLWEEYNPRCEPPWTERELRHKVEDAAKKPHDRPHGWLRDQARPSPASSMVRAPSDRAADAVPDDLFDVPGFVSDVVDATMQAAPYPNRPLAFAGALALLSFLTGRKVCDASDNRTNLYLLALADSASGKDAPRKMNTAVLHAVGQIPCLAQQLASGEGVEDALAITPSMLVQTDEIDAMLQAIQRSKDGRYESLMAILLSLYTSSASAYPCRRMASRGSRVIDQPSLVLFGTAIPAHYYGALSDRMLTNGLFGRMLVFEAGPRGAGQEPRPMVSPASVVETARWWTQQGPGPEGRPRVVPTDDDARARMASFRADADAHYDRAQRAGDAVATTVWGRAHEHARKLALLYAASESHEHPRISVDGADWACRLIEHQVTRMLRMVADHSSDGHFDGLAKRMLKKLELAPGGELDRSDLLRKSKQTKAVFDEVMDTLVERGDVCTDTMATAGRDKTVYRLVKKGEAS